MPKQYKPSEYMDLVKELILKNYPEEKFDSPLELTGETKFSYSDSKPIILSWEDIYHIKRKGETNKIEFKWGVLKEMEFDVGHIKSIGDLINFVPPMSMYAFFHREDLAKEKTAKMFMQTRDFKIVDLFYSDKSFANIGVNELPIEEALEKMIQAKALNLNS